MRKSLLTATAGLAALALTSPGPTAAQSEADQQLGNVSFETSCNDGGAAPLQPRHALSALVLVQRRQGDLRGGRQGRPGMRHGVLGRRAVAAQQSARRHPGGQPAVGLAAIQKAKEVGAKTERERDYIDALTLMYADYDKLSHTQRIRAFLGGDGEARGEISERRRGADRLRHHAQHLGVAGRQDLCPAEQRRGDPGADLKTAAATPRRHPLPDPSL